MTIATPSLRQLQKHTAQPAKAYSGPSSFHLIYLDFSKAFDSVYHRLPLVKLRGYGIAPTVLGWVEGFLSQQILQMNVNESISGVPQSSVIGPILFVMYVNDLPDHMSASSLFHADDAISSPPVTTMTFSKAPIICYSSIPSHPILRRRGIVNASPVKSLKTILDTNRTTHITNFIPQFNPSTHIIPLKKARPYSPLGCL